MDNANNLAASFLSQIVARYRGTRLGRQELDAEILEDVPGALWSRQLIEETRKDRGDMPPMKRIVVAIDPAVSVTESADETGIIVAGLGTDGHGYILEDASGKFSPIDWARRAVTLYRKWSADRIVAEQNQGGLMVETTLRTVDSSVSFKAVNASRGKITRAEPISALFEQGRAHLVGGFDLLEDQLCTWSAGSPGSPDRLDAMVWALTELALAPCNTGFLDWMKSEVDRMNGVGKSIVKPGTPLIEMRPPPTVTSISIGPRHIPVRDGVALLTVDEAASCPRGWRRDAVPR
jgi:phage terminase large subunit-like protein